MKALALLGVIGLGFVAAWLYFVKNAHPRTRPGPDGTDDITKAGRTDIRREPTDSGTPPSAPVPRMEVSSPLDVDPERQSEAAGWRALAEEIPFPSTYGKDVIVALIRTPRSVYVYWDRGGGGERALRQRLGEEAYAETVPVLRVWEGGRPVQTIQLHEHDDHWFVHDGLEPGHHYAFSYERRTPDGRYYRLSQSGPITMPYDTPGARTPDMLYRYLGGDQPGAVAGSVQR